MKIMANDLLFVGNTLNKLLDIYIPRLLTPGIKTIDIEKKITEYILKNNCIPATKGYFVDNIMFLHSVCISINNTAIHGVPSGYIIKLNDIIKIDCILFYKEIHVDAARTYFIGDDQEKKMFIKTCNNIYENIINFVKENKNIKIFELGEFINTQIVKNNFGNLDDFSGHHIGKQIHEKPLIVNSNKFGKDNNLLQGLFTIEPIIIKNKNFKYYVSKDNWSIVTDCELTFHREDTILIQDSKVYLITK
jgi:methionyl aminopeptidase